MIDFALEFEQMNVVDDVIPEMGLLPELIMFA